ncbi:hypothetical protein PUN28_016332 [Cardiocondyla obscurior]|uniref:Nose resistant-to-fluoxetine protein N-terminal domain-containing protein n=1 Tax=Cardiocondyla obscurior TaxID=286306 RepID=A0AAW2ES06_9HYME
MSRRQFTYVLWACINFTTLLCVSAHFPKSINDINDNSAITDHVIPAYVIASAASNFLNSTLCEKELLNFRDSVDQQILWSLQMLDSSGNLQSGFLYGNNFWLGSRSQCIDTMNTAPLQISERLSLNSTLHRNPQKKIPPFEVNYFVAHFRHNSTFQYHLNLPNEDVITLGLCLPASCSENDISVILQRIFQERILLISNVFSTDFELVQVKNLRNDFKWLTGGTLTICIILALPVFMVIIGTIYDIFVNQKNLNEKMNIEINKKNTIQIMEVEGTSSVKESKIGKMLICFSAYTNTKIIFNTKLHTDTIPVIHGIKFLNMCWIIAGHTGLYLADYIDNKVWTWKSSHSFISQIFLNSHIGVDTYFFLSGLLVTYFYIKDKVDKDRVQPLTYRAKINEFFILVIRRFIRLTPAYIATVIISQLSFTWFDKISQFYLHERPQETCSKYWWRNLLYINNLFSFDSMCLSWSWYLSADMQFFMITAALLILSTISFYLAAVILGALLIGSIVVTGYLSYIYEFVPTLDEQYRLVNVLYLPPWVRISPYIVGIIAGYVLSQLNGKLILKRKTAILCWCLGIACNLIVLFSMFDRKNMSILLSAIYAALHKGVWAVGIAWIVIACLTQHGGIVRQFLSYKGWAPLSRLSYCAYLLNPLLIQSLSALKETPIHFEFISLVRSYFKF